MTDVSKLPQELKDNGLFCLWRYEQRGDKRTKVPYDPRTGRMAQSNQPGTFAPLETALAAQRQGYDGLGVGIFGDVCAIDIDHCVKEDGTFTQVGMYVVAIMDSYTEYSPSGKGLRILFKAPGFVYDKAAYYINNARHGLEVYVAGATSKYVTVTGNMLAGYDTTLRECSMELRRVLDMYMRRDVVVDTAQSQMAGLVSQLQDSFAKPGSAEGEPKREANNCAADTAASSMQAASAASHDEAATVAFTDLQLLDKAIAAKGGFQFDALYHGNTQGYPSHSEADLALCCKLAFWTGCDKTQMDRMFRASGLMRADKWDRQQSGSTYGGITIDRALRDNRDTYYRGGNQ